MPPINVALHLRALHKAPPDKIPPVALASGEAEITQRGAETLNSRYSILEEDFLARAGDVRPNIAVYPDGRPIEPSNTMAAISGVETVRFLQAIAGG